VERTILNIALMERAKSSHADRMALHSQAEERLRLIHDPYGEIHSSTNTLSHPQRKKILYMEALNFYTDVYELEQEWLGSTHPTTARTLQIIGNLRWTILQEFGKNPSNNASVLEDITQTDALRDLTQAAQGLEMALGPIHPHVANACLDLAGMHDVVGNSEQALELYERALFAQRAYLRDVHVDIATTLNNIGVVYYAQNNYDKALKAYKEASAVYTTLHKQGEGLNPDASLVWNNVGELYKHTQQYELASHAFEQSLKLLKQSPITEDAVLASTMISSGEVYVQRKKYDKALMIFQQAYAIQCNKQHPLDLVTTLENIGDVREMKGQFQMALECLIVALQIRRENLGEDHANNALTLLKIGTLHGKMHRHQEAFIFLSESLRIFHRNGFPRDHPRVKEARRKRKGAKMSIPGATASKSSPPSLSEMMYETPSPKRGELDALDNMAESYLSRGHYEDALDTYQTTLQMRREILGSNHLDVGVTLSNLACIHRQKDELAEAAILFKEALRLYKMNGVEKGHPHVRKVLSELKTFT